jgi:hypothetical protein
VKEAPACGDCAGPGASRTARDTAAEKSISVLLV